MALRSAFGRGLTKVKKEQALLGELLTPTLLPIADDEEVRRTRRRSQARQRARRGRASTIFTQGEGLGG